MSDVLLCRICLKRNTKLCSYDLVRNVYVHLVNLEISNDRELPQYICTICMSSLLKFGDFKRRCHIALSIFQNLLSVKGQILDEDISSIDLKLHNLDSSLGYCANMSKVGYFQFSENGPTTAQNLVEAENFNKPLKFEINNDNDDENYDDNDDDNDDDIENDYDIENDDDHTSDNDDELNDMKENKSNIDEDIKNNVEKINTDCKTYIEIELDGVGIGDEYKKMDPNVSNETTEDVESTKSTKENKAKKVFKSQIWQVDETKWKLTKFTEEEALELFNKKSQMSNFLLAPPHKCFKCIKSFSREDMLLEHNSKAHNENFKMVCNICKMRFETDDERNQHVRDHYYKFDCLRCDFHTNFYKGLVTHERKHDMTTKTCIPCGETFLRLETYYTHLRTSHRSEHVCEKCGRFFVSPMKLDLHRASLGHDVPDMEYEREYYCEKCDTNYLTEKGYQNHFKFSRKHVGKPDVVKPTPSKRPRAKRNISAKVKIPIIPMSRSSLFPDSTQTPSNMGQSSEEQSTAESLKNETKSTAIRTKPTTCYQCGEHFETQHAYKKHHVSVHRGTSFYPPTAREICETCGASVAPGTIATHMNTHTKSKLFPCETCGRQFYTKFAMTRHFVTHTGEKKYACTLCDKRFTQRDSVKLHYRTFHLKQPYPKRIRNKKEQTGTEG